jgi:hypothetical protein
MSVRNETSQVYPEKVYLKNPPGTKPGGFCFFCPLNAKVTALEVNSASSSL